MDHRGRFQAQGGATEKSEPWSQASPLSTKDALKLLDRLEAALSPAEYVQRKGALRKAREFVHRASRAGGIQGRYARSFWDDQNHRAIRVDLEVCAGKAFVSDEE